MSGRTHDLQTPRATKEQMLYAVRILDAAGYDDRKYVLMTGEINGLTEKARRVAKKYWETKGRLRTAQSLQNHLDRPRWKYLDQAPEAHAILREITDDSGLTGKYFPASMKTP